MSVVYGYEPRARDDPLVQVIEHAQDLGIAVMTPEKSKMLKTFPFCECTVFKEGELYVMRVLTLECSTEVT
jgi:hypothetical protein